SLWQPEGGLPREHAQRDRARSCRAERARRPPPSLWPSRRRSASPPPGDSANKSAQFTLGHADRHFGRTNPIGKTSMIATVNAYDPKSRLGGTWLRASYRLARRRLPGLQLLVALGVAVERAFEIAERDDEAGPAVAIAALEHVVLDEGPRPVPERRPHGDALARELGHAERGVAVHLADDLLEVAERQLPDLVRQAAERGGGEELVALVHRLERVAHRAFAEELRLPVVRVPAGAADPAPHEVGAARDEVDVVRRVAREQAEDFVAHRGRAALVG